MKWSEEHESKRGSLTFCAICNHPFTQTNVTNTRMYCTPACARVARLRSEREGRIRRGEQVRGRARPRP